MDDTGLVLEGTARAEAEARPNAGARLAERLSLLLPLSALLVLVVYFSLASDAFFSQANLFNIVRQSSVLLVVALAGTFVVLLGSIDLSVGSIVTFTGIATALAIARWGDAAVLLALLAALLWGLANGLLHAYGKLPSFLVTLGTLFVIDGVALIVSAGRPQPFRSEALTALMGGTSFGGFPTIALWAAAILALSVFLARQTRFGRYLVAIGDGERVARLSGVNVDRIKLYTFALSGLLAGLGGVMLAVRTSSGAPGMGASFLLDSIAAIVMGGTALTGGVGGPHRTILGVLVIVVLSNGMTLTDVDPFYQVVIRGAVVIGAVALTMRRGELSLVK